jgi:hypothetical protein
MRPRTVKARHWLFSFYLQKFQNKTIFEKLLDILKLNRHAPPLGVWHQPVGSTDLRGFP